jgi:hypothetical protein
MPSLLSQNEDTLERHDDKPSNNFRKTDLLPPPCHFELPASGCGDAVRVELVSLTWHRFDIGCFDKLGSAQKITSVSFFSYANEVLQAEL